MSDSWLSLEHAKDQGFTRQVVQRSDPTLVPCLLPKGKYVVTGRWQMLRGEDPVAVISIVCINSQTGASLSTCVLGYRHDVTRKLVCSC